MRYGHQRLPDIMDMTLDETLAWALEIADLVREENESARAEEE